MATVSQTIDRARLRELIELERGKLLARTEGSQAYYERAIGVMPRGVPSSFQAADPRPIYSRNPDSISDDEMGVFPDYEAFCAAAG